MINKSKKESPGQWEKWEKSGALESHPDSLEAKGFKKAELQIDPPTPGHNNFMLSFDSTSMDDLTRKSYIAAIKEVTHDVEPMVFFQGGQLEGDTWHMFEFWGSESSDNVKKHFDDIHEEARKIFKRQYRKKK